MLSNPNTYISVSYEREESELGKMEKTLRQNGHRFVRECIQNLGSLREFELLNPVLHAESITVVDGNNNCLNYNQHFYIENQHIYFKQDTVLPVQVVYISIAPMDSSMFNTLQDWITAMQNNNNGSIPNFKAIRVLDSPLNPYLVQ